MIIYNVTIKVDWPIHEEWLKWMMDIHIPEVIGTGCFERHQLVRLLEVDETEGPTYSVQYYATSKAKYDEYIELYSSTLRQKSIDLWGDKFIAFRTIMQIVN